MTIGGGFKYYIYFFKCLSPYILRLFSNVASAYFFQMGWLKSPKYTPKKHPYKTRWWFQIFFIFTPIWGRFRDGLKPPTRKLVEFWGFLS